MNWRRRVLFGLVFFLSVAAAPCAQAQIRIGEAAVIHNEVVNDSTAGQINVGDNVMRDETVRTGADSAARLVMADSTNLSLGANATLKLDRSIFNDEHTYREIAIRLASGAFRFVTGHSEKAAYRITTPLATIGVRGTILDILSERGRTTVVLQEGAARVCALSFQCLELTQPGDTAIITLTGGKTTIQKTANTPWTFAASCAAATGLCTVTDYADAGTPDDPNAMLCGH